MTATICDVGVHQWLSNEFEEGKAEPIFQIASPKGPIYNVDICLACGQLKPTDVKQ